VFFGKGYGSSKKGMERKRRIEAIEKLDTKGKPNELTIINLKALEMRIVMIAFTNIEYTIELAEALTELVDVRLMIPDKQAQRFQDVLKPNFKVNSFRLPRMRQIRNLYYVYKMLIQIRKLNPDVIHLQRGHPWFNLAIYFLIRYCLVTTIHDVILHTGDKESKIVPSFTHKIAINNADKVIVHGEKLKTEMISKSKKPPNDIAILHRGINSIYRRYIERPFQEENNSILFFGRIWGYKGLSYLIKAEPFITKEVPDVKIVIAGRGENFQKYEDMMINKEKFTVYNKHISNRMVAELFQKASVVVLPYTDASQSGVIPLAYAFKKPVIATNVGSLPEVVDHGITGYIVPPREKKKLGEAVVDLLKDEEKRRRMGKNAYEKATKELSWDKIALKTVNLYKEAILAKKMRR
jgi:glycosyltransferase involved in cell wall biosynthesis